jgi:hypothetical protein
MKRRPIVVAVVVGAVVGFVAAAAVFVLRRDEPVKVDRSAGSVSVPAGEQLHISFGTVNTSVGDLWVLTVAPDAAVLKDRGTDYTTAEGCGGRADEGFAGCDQSLVWVFEAVRAGTTTVQFQYCYRSRPPNCEPSPTGGSNAPVSLSVTVTRPQPRSRPPRASHHGTPQGARPLP